MRVLFALTALVALEVGLFVQLGPVLGLGAVLAELLLSAAAGVVVLRGLGQAALEALQAPVRLRRAVALPIAEGGLTAMGAILLILPGLAGDTIGALLLVPPLRRWLAARFVAGAEASVNMHRSGRDGAAEAVILDAEYYDVTPSAEDRAETSARRLPPNPD